MPTANPRLQVTFEPETYEVLKRLAAVQGRPASTIVREVMQGSTGMLSEIADTMERLKAAQEAAKARIVAEAGQGLEDAADALQPPLLALLEHFEAVGSIASDFLADNGIGGGALLSAPGSRPQRSEDGKPARSKGVSADADPQPVIRGSGFPKRLKLHKGGSC